MRATPVTVAEALDVPPVLLPELGRVPDGLMTSTNPEPTQATLAVMLPMVTVSPALNGPPVTVPWLILCRCTS